MEACQRGQLLLLAPWEHHNEQLTIRRNQCLMLNDLAKMICEKKKGRGTGNRIAHATKVLCGLFLLFGIWRLALYAVT